MNDTPRLPLGGRLIPSGRQYRSTSQSPTRQRHVSDDLISHLSPMNAIEAFRSPSGSLKLCMDAASATEQAFAMRAAVASKNIYEWLDELEEWPWPAEGGSMGFAIPTAKRRKLSFGKSIASFNGSATARPSTPTKETIYMGSLPAADVVQYERRIEEIQRDMEDLDVEEIKRHVLHNHILPLSRPGTPMSDNRSATSSSSYYTRMDDLTATITATVVQTLPNLSKLMRLMNTWTVRLAVLRRVPSMLKSLSDAEVAIQSGWNAIELGEKKKSEGPIETSPAQNEASTLSRKDFEIMKLVLEKKVAKAARDLDYMLDSLEGHEDTLPDEWCDRMDTVEHEYSSWVGACERKLQQANWANLAHKQELAAQMEFVRDGSPSRVVNAEALEDHSPQANADRATQKDEVRGDPELLVSSVESLEVPDETSTDGQEGCHGSIPTVQISPVNAVASLVSDEDHSAVNPDLDFESDFPTQEQSIDLSRELSLPLNYQDSRPSTSASDTSTVIHPLRSTREDSSDLPDFVETPELPQLRHTEEFPSDRISPPSSPPGFRTNTRASSVSFIDIPPPLAEVSDDDTPPKTPMDSSFMDDTEFSQDVGSPSKMSEASSADDQLQQQISEILESIPAKIHLSSQPSTINLNPPDIQLPYTKPRPVDRQVRSYSSLSSRASSRASTPSFMLAPAYARNARPRHQRGNQEIKLYHLSRSTGEPPIKLFIRCVGENGERVMVRVGGGWADLGEYLKDYASHHGRRSGAGNEGKVEIRDLPRVSTGRAGSSPPSRPASAMDSPITPLNVRKTRKSVGEESAGGRLPKTPLATALFSSDPPSSGSTRSRSSSRLSWTEEDSTLGMAGPKAKTVEMSDESKAWVESVKEKVRIASGERKPSDHQVEKKFGELGKVGGTKRLFRRAPG